MNPNLAIDATSLLIESSGTEIFNVNKKGNASAL